MTNVLKTIKGFGDTDEARSVEAAIEKRHAGAALFAPTAGPSKFAPSAPKL